MKKFKKSSLYPLTILIAMSFAPAAHAGFLSFCKKLLGGQTSRFANVRSNNRKPSKKLLPKAYQSYLEKKQSTPPPSAAYDSSTSITDLLTSPAYWWYPGNIWYSSFQPYYSADSQEILDKHESTSLPSEIDPRTASILQTCYVAREIQNNETCRVADHANDGQSSARDEDQTTTTHHDHSTHDNSSYDSSSGNSSSDSSSSYDSGGSSDSGGGGSD